MLVLCCEKLGIDCASCHLTQKYLNCLNLKLNNLALLSVAIPNVKKTILRLESCVYECRRGFSVSSLHKISYKIEPVHSLKTRVSSCPFLTLIS